MPFFQKIDYYQALGLNSEATLEELKAAYINLALLYHPDTASANSTAKHINKEDEFIKISEAWSVLSKPDLKSQYDSLRRIHLNKTGRYGLTTSGIDSEISTEISQGFNTQKMNFSKVQARAASNWEDLQDKYKTEKWQNMPLHERKVSEI